MTIEAFLDAIDGEIEDIREDQLLRVLEAEIDRLRPIYELDNSRKDIYTRIGGLWHIYDMIAPVHDDY